MTRRAALALAVTVLLASACSGGDPNAADGAATSAGVEEAATAPAAGAAPAGPPAPELRTTGEDFDVVWRSLAAYRTWLFRNPSPEGLDRIALPDCPCYADDRALLEAHAQAGQRWTGSSTAVLSVEVVDHAAPDLVTLRVTQAREGTSELVGADGVVHRTLEPAGPNVTDYVLVREDAAAPWKLRDYAELPAPEELPR